MSSKVLGMPFTCFRTSPASGIFSTSPGRERGECPTFNCAHVVGRGVVFSHGFPGLNNWHALDGVTTPPTIAQQQAFYALHGAITWHRAWKLTRYGYNWQWFEFLGYRKIESEPIETKESSGLESLTELSGKVQFPKWSGVYREDTWRPVMDPPDLDTQTNVGATVFGYESVFEWLPMEYEFTGSVDQAAFIAMSQMAARACWDVMQTEFCGWDDPGDSDATCYVKPIVRAWCALYPVNFWDDPPHFPWDNPDIPQSMAHYCYGRTATNYLQAGMYLNTPEDASYAGAGMPGASFYDDQLDQVVRSGVGQPIYQDTASLNDVVVQFIDPTAVPGARVKSVMAYRVCGWDASFSGVSDAPTNQYPADAGGGYIHYTGQELTYGILRTAETYFVGSYAQEFGVLTQYDGKLWLPGFKLELVEQGVIQHGASIKLPPCGPVAPLTEGPNGLYVRAGYFAVIGKTPEEWAAEQGVSWGYTGPTTEA